tara:strand:+ start:717 stop:1784 length:1068 start_codon:yes stop_codon:yes gene_type:complete
MNRRKFISSIISTLLYLYQTRLSATEKSSKSIDDYFKTPNLIKNNTVIITDPIFLEHHIAPNHPETPERVEYIQKALHEYDLSEITEQINSTIDVSEWIRTIHTLEHIESIKQSSPIAHKVATAGVRASLLGVDKIVTKEFTNAFCATRPPGHHALNTGREEGFCYYNNIAIAAKYAQERYKLEKILIIDWDYHHGNSTEAMFYDDPSVLFFSTHDKFAYPGTGDPAKKGRGDGEGFNINIHLPCGTTDKMIIDKFNNVLLPAAKKFKPNLVLISAGFDSRQNDLLGCFAITDNGFIRLTKIAMNIANEFCDDRLVSILEGGYNLQGNAKAVIAHALTLERNIFADSAVSISGCR